MIKDKDLGLVFIQDALMKDVESYLKAGRMYEALSDSELDQEFFKRIKTQTNISPSVAAQIITSLNEIQPEFSLRNREAPYESVRDDLDSLLKIIVTEIDKRIRDNKLPKDGNDEGLVNDFREFVNSLNEPKN